MTHQSSLIVRSAATVALLFALAPAAHADTLYVKNNGVDGTLCGDAVQHPTVSFLHPCRSITHAIANAAPGDTIIVGPGRYSGDLDNDGILGEPGEEIGSPGCGCMLSVNKPVILVSSSGAASTVIAARDVDVAKNVLLILNGGEFGRPGKGFTVTNTHADRGEGIVIDSTNVKVRGNQVLATLVFPFTVQQPLPGDGILAIGSGPIPIEGNQVIGQWSPGIAALGTSKTVRKNQVSVSGSGIGARGDNVVVGNIVTATGSGIILLDEARAVGNAVHGNFRGIEVQGNDFSGVIERNNIFGNIECGVLNFEVPNLLAKNNYWGAASGPGPDPADDVCNEGEGSTTTVTPFATTPFIVRAPIRP